MNGSARFTVTDRTAPRKAAAPGIRRIASQISDETARRTPVVTGRLRSGWEIAQGRDVATHIVRNRVPYARHVEYGTKRPRRRARPMLGPVLASWRARMSR